MHGEACSRVEGSSRVADGGHARGGKGGRGCLVVHPHPHPHPHTTTHTYPLNRPPSGPASRHRPTMFSVAAAAATLFALLASASAALSSATRPRVVSLPAAQLRPGRTPLYLGVLHPYNTSSGSLIAGDGMETALIMGLEAINSQTEVLPGVELRLVISDDGCDPTLVPARLLSQLVPRPGEEPTPPVGFIGSFCSASSMVMSRMAHQVGLSVVSGGSTSPALSDSKVLFTYRLQLHIMTATQCSVFLSLMLSHTTCRKCLVSYF